MDVIALDQLTKRYGSRLGVESLSLTVPAGAMYGFLGPNGAGKTTTIRVLMGLLSPSAGRASIFGQDCWRRSPSIKAEVGYLPGDLRLPPWMNGDEALTLFGRIRGRDLRDAGRRLAEEFELDPTLRVRAMSRGTRQKLGLVLALAHEPRLMILDEPTASLDPLVQRTLYAQLRQAVSQGRTVLLSSHTLSEVEGLCTHVAVLRQGRLAVCDSVEQLRSIAKRRVTVHWSPNAAVAEIATPEFIIWTSQENACWTGVVRGPAARVAEWLARQPITDFSLEAPNLSEIFQSYYT